ncbi:MAG: GDSL-type esterase/lipase family protein [Bacteroidota bacterium]
MRWSKIWVLFFLWNALTYGQNSFQEEVVEIQKRLDTVEKGTKPRVVFTGSSSIRLWDDIVTRFPEVQVLNTGFGGSHCSDLLYFIQELVLDYEPDRVFIYEGDNDIFAKKRPKKVIETFTSVLDILEKERPDLDIVLISAKPSIARWHYRGRYKRLNKRLKKLVEERPKVSYVDVWDVMLNGKKLNRTLFIEDGLHMNSAGYDIWYGVLKPLVLATK